MHLNLNYSGFCCQVFSDTENRQIYLCPRARCEILLWTSWLTKSFKNVWAITLLCQQRRQKGKQETKTKPHANKRIEMRPTDPTWLLSQHREGPPHPRHLPSRLKGSRSSLEPTTFSVTLDFSLACFPNVYTQTCLFFFLSHVYRTQDNKKVWVRVRRRKKENERVLQYCYGELHSRKRGKQN